MKAEAIGIARQHEEPVARLMAGKIHAIATRNMTKGRDWITRAYLDGLNERAEEAQ